jgi:hypothetical protein
MNELNCKEPIKQINWMTKRIKKGDKTHIGVPFCPNVPPEILESSMGRRSAP